MRPGTANIAGMIAFMALLTAGCASDNMKPSSAPSMSSGSAAGTAAHSSTGSPTKSSKNIDQIASGSAEDSFDACLSRIPKDASSGQRMLAEQSCRRDYPVR
jgi:hypothetical protein